MRHRKKKTIELKISSVQKKSLILRNMLTNLVRYGHVTTTSKKAFLLKAYADSFFARVVRTVNIWAKDGRREAIRYIKSVVFTEPEWKKVIDELVPKFIEQKNKSYIADYKLGMRKGDSAEEVMLKII